jgi:hypothetical protein
VKADSSAVTAPKGHVMEFRGLKKTCDHLSASEPDQIPMRWPESLCQSTVVPWFFINIYPTRSIGEAEIYAKRARPQIIATLLVSGLRKEVVIFHESISAAH